MNHHQLPLCRELAKQDDVEFTFIATKPIDSERLRLGYADLNGLSFVFRSYDDGDAEKTAERICFESDVLIIGDAAQRYYIRRLTQGKPTLRYSERIFKTGLLHSYSLRARVNMQKLHGRYRNDPVWLLCAGAYTASDFNRMGAYKNKCLKWGYFPEFREYSSVSELISGKRSFSLLWAGRFIDWKHPELAIETALFLKKQNIEFHLDMIGTGYEWDKIRKSVDELGLSDHVSVLGAQPPENVRAYMEKSDIFLFTSDFNEGWGAVLNEAMNSGCAVVASHAIGAVPFMIENRKNGLIYKNGDKQSLFESVMLALKNDGLRKAIQQSAYETVRDKWNPAAAAKRLTAVCRRLRDGDTVQYCADGPCSKAEVLKNNWFSGECR